mgnify:CR=1 FL=1
MFLGCDFDSPKGCVNKFITGKYDAYLPDSKTIWNTPRKGKRVGTFIVTIEEEHEAKKYKTDRIMQITKKTMDKYGQFLLTPKLALEGWWTTLKYSNEDVFPLDRDPATLEQFHSEIKRIWP